MLLLIRRPLGEPSTSHVLVGAKYNGKAMDESIVQTGEGETPLSAEYDHIILQMNYLSVTTRVGPD